MFTVYILSAGSYVHVLPWEEEVVNELATGVA